MILVNRSTTDFDVADVKLTGNRTVLRDALRHQIEIGLDLHLYLTPAEMSNLGHRLIALGGEAWAAEHQDAGAVA